MDALQFWKQKVIQFFHDPPGKPFAFYPGSGGHKALAQELFARFYAAAAERPEHRYASPWPDIAAAGADRPLLKAPRGEVSAQFGWPGQPLITHPLCRARLDLRRTGQDQLATRAIREAMQYDQLEEIEHLQDPLADWQDAAGLERDFVRLWRRYREALLSGSNLGDDLLWKEMPADGRSPDHSIWDHLRVTTSLAFLPSGKAARANPEHPRAPWLLRFSLHPVQRFIREARTSRDLWVGSFLLADLAWHAMRPIVERYGHDCILYPDLCGNPHVDNWLARHGEDPQVLPPAARDAATYAALLPDNFTAVVPYGEPSGHLVPIRELATRCRNGVEERWHALERSVWAWFERAVAGSVDKQGLGTLREIWQRQHKQVIGTAWSAVAWLPPEPIRTVESLRGRALPAQHPRFRSQRDPADLAAIAERRERLAPWVPDHVWWHYEAAREVAARSNLRLHQAERGFDYALTHHQLGVRHRLRREVRTEGRTEAEPGEKCTCCGRRQALTPGVAGHVASDRADARVLWSIKALDPEERGAERLCAVCAMKRFLVPAGVDGDRLSGINPIWAGPQPAAEVADRDGKVRVPFPSTATVAAQRFIDAAVRHPALETELGAVVAAHRALGLAATSFPRALARLAAAAQASVVRASDVRRRFLELEAEEVLFPNAIDGAKEAHLRSKQDPEERSQIEAGYAGLKDAVRGLLRAARAQGIALPQRRIAVLTMDADRMGRLLLGSEDAIQTRWRDIIHPRAVAQIEDPTAGRQWLRAAGWPALLDSKRLIGPSLHAFISRALAAFQQTIVPWVVEREFGGRLIYSGGDDVLCLLPGDEALDLAARLQQLFAAPWVIDTAPDHDPWAWRRADVAFNYDPDRARERFVVPRIKEDRPLRLPIDDATGVDRHVAAANGPSLPIDGRVIPMLGPGHSLSAGIAFAHYKAPLAGLLARAHQLLDDEAKDRAGRGAVAISHASRGGEKNAFAMPWRAEEGLALGAHAALTKTIWGFQDGSLPGRLPYKLRELTPHVAVVLERTRDDPNQRELWLRGLFEQELGATSVAGCASAAFSIWFQGLKLYNAERALGGLLVCRALAGNEEDAE